MAYALVASQIEQRKFNIGLAHLLRLIFAWLTISALATLIVIFEPQKITAHGGGFGRGFSADFDVNRLDLDLPLKLRLSWAGTELYVTAPYLRRRISLMLLQP